MEKPTRERFKNRRETIRPVAVKLSQIQDKLGPSRRRMMAMVLLPLIALLVLGAGYIVYAQDRSQQLTSDISAHKSDIRRRVAAFSEKYTKEKDQKSQAALLQQVAKELPKINCGPSHLLYPPLMESMKQCTAENAAVNRIAHDLQTIAGIVTYDSDINSAILAGIAADNNASTSWNDKQKTWQQIANTYKKTTAPSNFQAIHKKLSTQAGTIASAWQALAKADQAHNSKDFEAAKKNLAIQYAALRKLSEAYKTPNASLQSQLVTDYKQTQ